MGLRIPQNQVIQSKYTAGKEYILESTYREYQGYYYEFNGKIFAGKELTADSPVLISIPKNNNNNTNINSLLTNAATYIYGKISKVKVNNNKFTSLTKLDDPNIDKEGIDTYYIKKLNSGIIKQIDEDTFKKLQSDPLYKTVVVKADHSNLDQVENTIPGITLFVKPSSTTQEIIYPTQLFPQAILSTPVLLTGSITDTPRLQDIVPVGPIYIIK